MNPIKFFTAILLALISTICVAFIGVSYVSQQPATNTEPAGFAVVELFTSEGCSSCPAADALAGKTQLQYKDKPVYMLAYHVDYWDRMGWKDAYSSKAYTQRQSEYSQLLGSQLYTPQTVVNGQQEFVGSNEKSLSEAIEKAIGGKSATKITIGAEQKKRSLLVNYTITGNYTPAVIRLALIQKTATRDIRRGENQGRTLTHWQIVRAFNTATIGTSGSGKLQLSLPDDFKKDGWEIIAIVQNPETGKMYGATKTAFSETKAGR